MARINVNIEAEDAADLRSTMLDLAVAFGADVYAGDVAVVEAVEEPQAVEAEPEAPKKGRGRPKKDANGSGAPTPEPQADAGAATGSDLADELFAAEAAEEVTFDQMQATGRAYFAKHGAEATAAKLAAIAGGAQSFKQVAPEFYAVVHQTLGADL